MHFSFPLSELWCLRPPDLLTHIPGLSWLRISEKQYRLWDRLLQLAIAQAQRNGVSVHEIIDPIGDKLLQCAFGWYVHIPRPQRLLF